MSASANQSGFVCFHCGAEIAVVDNRVGRGDCCESCSYDLHVCLNCSFYDRSSHNECKEPMAERVLDKDHRNFCDYFALGRGSPPTASDPKSEAIKKLNDLFK